ncbi:MAG: ssDNA-binding protein [Janthinobacterium lividum]
MAEQRVVVTRGKNFMFWSDGTITIENVRLSHPHIFVAVEGKDNNKRPNGKFDYSCVGLAPKDTHKEFLQFIKKHMQEILNDKKPKNWPASKDYVIPADKKFVRNGDDTPKLENHGSWIISAREKKRPAVRDINGAPLSHESQEDQDSVYGGVWGSLLVRPWYQNNDNGERINANLIAVRLTRTPAGRSGDALGAGRLAQDEIDKSFGDDSYDTEQEVPIDDDL